MIDEHAAVKDIEVLTAIYSTLLEDYFSEPASVALNPR